MLALLIVIGGLACLLFITEHREESARFTFWQHNSAINQTLWTAAVKLLLQEEKEPLEGNVTDQTAVTF